MKTNNQFRQVLLATLLIMLTYTTACKKEDCEIPLPVSMDKSADMIAFFDPLNLILYVEPTHLEAVLADLNAKPLETGLFAMESNTYGGDRTEVLFTISLQENKAIQEQSIATDAVLQELLIAEPEQVKQTATMKLSYRNNTCSREVSARTGVCHVIGRESTQTHYDFHYKCEGSLTGDICTETHQPIGQSRRYRNRECREPSYKINTLYGFRCD